MNVLVIGATGKTGRLVVRSALDAGHSVVAFGRSVDRLEFDDPGYRGHKGDALQPDQVAAALDGQDAVIVCLGSTGLKDATTLSHGTKSVVDAAAGTGKRLVVMSAAGAGESWKQIPLSSKFAFRTFLRKILADHEAQEAIVEASDLDWTIVRAAVLKDDDATGDYTLTLDGKTTKITRADVAACLVDQLTADGHRRQAVAVTN